MGSFVYDEFADGDAVAKRREVFYHTDPDVAKLAFQDLIKGKFDAKKYKKIGELPAQIVKFEEKHGETFYVYTSREQFYRIFLSVFMDRYKDNWFDFDDVDEPQQPMSVNNTPLTDDDVNAIGDKKLQAFQRERLVEFKNDLKEYEKMKIEQEIVERILEEQNGQLALTFMEKRRNCEYENFEIIEPEIV